MPKLPARPFRRLLVANRGEIALRVIRAAREMGLETVAVHSEPDAGAMHVRMAHWALPLGGSSPAESYLRVDKLLDAARASGAEAIHPGYGFLSERAHFARAVLEAGLVWVGPPPDAIDAMGDKVESRKRMQAAGVPLVPGAVAPAEDVRAALAQAADAGFPVALKAAAGGGGKGIRLVRAPSEMEAAFRAASGEAQSSFGDGRLYVERYLQRPRHVEVQVLFDAHGHGVHLGVRECSVQRRHQKLVEECPSVIVDEVLRERMGEAALRAARAVGYVNAGTVEFLIDAAGVTPGASGASTEFYFLEMNTRLQVEHPVTEMVTGRDLVQDQLRVAMGEPLGYAQSELRWDGWAIEVRLNAEDPSTGFLPSTGVVHNLRLPGGPGVRLDSALYNGLEVGLAYDPLLAKLVVWAPTRAHAIARARRALEELNVGGVRTSAPAALRVLEDARFTSGDYDTHLLEHLDLAAPRATDARERLVASIAAAVHRRRLGRRKALGPTAGERAGWLARERASASAWELDGRRGRGGSSA